MKINYIFGFLFLIICLIVLDQVKFSFNSHYFKTDVPPHISVIGTESRLEREYKLRVPFISSNPLTINKLFVLMRTLINAEGNLQVPKILGEPYRIETLPNVIFMRDYYLDTENNLLKKNGLVYRIRFRFSQNIFSPNNKSPFDEINWPHRVEIQSKKNLKNEHGLFVSEESRLEFHPEKLYEHTLKLPDNYWEPDTFFVFAQEGQIDKRVHTPALLILKNIKILPSEKIVFKPTLVVQTRRERIHLNMPTKTGSGPNPTQAYIITLDTAVAYSYKEFEKYFEMLKYHKRILPPAVNQFKELEIEFERNTSTFLTDQKSIDAFFHDQKFIYNRVIDYLNSNNIPFQNSDSGKYFFSTPH